MESLLQSLIPLLIPIVVMLGKKIVTVVPRNKIPFIVASLGAVSGLFTGQPDAEIIQTVTQALNNAGVGLAGIGVYEVYKAPKRNR